MCSGPGEIDLACGRCSDPRLAHGENPGDEALCVDAAERPCQVHRPLSRRDVDVESRRAPEGRNLESTQRGASAIPRDVASETFYGQTVESSGATREASFEAKEGAVYQKDAFPTRIRRHAQTGLDDVGVEQLEIQRPLDRELPLWTAAQTEAAAESKVRAPGSQMGVVDVDHRAVDSQADVGPNRKHRRLAEAEGALFER